MTQRLELNNGKLVEYNEELANSKGLNIFVLTYLRSKEKREFIYKVRAERDVFHFYFPTREKKNLRKFVFEQMKKKGYVTDGEIVEYLGELPNFGTVETYKTAYKKEQYLKNLKK